MGTMPPNKLMTYYTTDIGKMRTQCIHKHFIKHLKYFKSTYYVPRSVLVSGCEVLHKIHRS